jgi:outer membrane protein assembly factor BamB
MPLLVDPPALPRPVPVRPAVVPAQVARAQFVPQEFAAADEGQIVLAPREQARALRMAAELVESGQHVEATELLQRVLELGEDSFVQPDADKEVYRSLWREAQRIVGELPPAALETYRRQFGPEAERLLEAAIADGDPLGLVEVTRRFFHTEAGRKANYRLGAWHFDHGQFLAAALCFQRLRETGEADALEPALTLRAAVCWHHAGQPERAEALLDELAERGEPVTLGGEPVPLADGPFARAKWLASIVQRPAVLPGVAASWSGHRGGAHRNPVIAATGRPGELLWTASPTADPFRTEREIAEDEFLQKLAIEGGANLKGDNLPVRQPLVVGDMVLVRSLSGVTALDRGDAGDFLWQGFRDADFERQLPADGELSGAAQWAGGIRTKAAHHVWHDAAFGRMSTDGERVYSIEAPDKLPAGVNSAQHVSRSNMLCAYDLLNSEGRQEWAVGGETDVGIFEMPLAGRFFLGPPLPLGGQLYCLAQNGGEVELLVLDARTGALAWRQPLVGVSDAAGVVESRRQSGAVVAVADGIVVCPTTSGTFVALDLTTRSLLWAYRALPGRQPVDPNVRRLGGRAIIIVNGRQVIQQPQAPRGGWQDETPVIVEGRVLLTALHGDEVHCVSLLDGSLLWKQPRKEAVYLAGAADGTALLVGERSIRGVKLADGKDAWTELSVPTVVGTGLLADGRLWLPTERELIAVGAKDGKVAIRQRVPEAVSLGNLAATSDLLISQGVSEVYAFPWQPDADAAADAR